MSTVRAAILGFAHAHVGSYCQQWLTTPSMGIELAGGWDHDPGRMEAACGKLGIPPAGDINALLGSDAIQAVVIGSETGHHAELVELAASAGKAVVLQKPMAVTLDEAGRIVKAVRQHNIPFTLAWQMRADPHNLQVRQLLADGKFGALRQIRRRHCLSTHLWDGFAESWHVDPKLNRDIFADDASHPIDFIYWLMGMPVSVCAEMGTLRNPSIINDHAIAVFRYPDGAFAEISCSFAAAGGENNLEVLCDNGVIIGNYGDQVSCMLPRPPGGIQLKWYLTGDAAWTTSDLPDIHEQGMRIAGLAAPLADFLHGRRPAIATAEEGLDVLRMTLACYASAEKGRREFIEYPASAQC